MKSNTRRAKMQITMKRDKYSFTGFQEGMILKYNISNNNFLATEPGFILNPIEKISINISIFKGGNNRKRSLPGYQCPKS